MEHHCFCNVVGPTFCHTLVRKGLLSHIFKTDTAYFFYFLDQNGESFSLEKQTSKLYNLLQGSFQKPLNVQYSI